MNAGPCEYWVFDLESSFTVPFILAEFQQSPPPQIDKDTKVIIDIGANVGMWCFYMAKLYPKAKITAYEPMHLNYQNLVRGVMENQFSNISPLKSAVGAVAGTSTLFMDLVNSGSGSEYLRVYEKNVHLKEEVECVALKDVVAPHAFIDLLKVDIEGAEFKLFNGFEDWDKVGSLLVEVHPWAVFPDENSQLDLMGQFHGWIKNKMGGRNIYFECSNREILKKYHDRHPS